MGDLEKAIKASKQFEAALTRRYGAKGRGLHEKVDSVEAKLDRQLVRDLRMVATVRNKLVHEEGYDRIEDEGSFDVARRRANKALKIRSGRPPKWLLLVILVALGAAGFAIWRIL